MAARVELPPSEQNLLQDACAAFQQASGRFKATPVAMEVRRERVGAMAMTDGSMRFDLNGRLFDMPFSVKERIGDPADIAKRRKRIANGADRPLLRITRFVPPEQAIALIERGIPFLDTAGNVYLDEPEGMVMITGRPRPARIVQPGSARSTTPKGMQVMYAIATTPGLVAMPYRTISEKAGVALNTVNKAIDDLIARGLVAQKKSGARIVPDWKRFVSEWVNLYPSQLRQRLGSRRFSSTSADWWSRFDFAPFAEKLDLRIGGEAAAEVMTHLLKASRTTIYTRSPVSSQFMVAARLRPDDTGDVEILDTFWPRATDAAATSPAGPPLVNPLLIYADLVATGDSRNLSIAEQIYDEHLLPLQS
jgi:hypothetical protein